MLVGQKKSSTSIMMMKMAILKRENKKGWTHARLNEANPTLMRTLFFSSSDNANFVWPTIEFLGCPGPAWRYQNIKTTLNFLEENHWARPFFALFSSVREKLQFTVSLNHPVVMTTMTILPQARSTYYPTSPNPPPLPPSVHSPNSLRRERGASSKNGQYRKYFGQN